MILLLNKVQRRLMQMAGGAEDKVQTGWPENLAALPGCLQALDCF